MCKKLGSMELFGLQFFAETFERKVSSFRIQKLVSIFNRFKIYPQIHFFNWDSLPPCKAQQPLRGMKLQEKETQKG